jgi:hypothetical protein
MKTQEPYQIACFIYALGFANGMHGDVQPRSWRASRSPRRSLRKSSELFTQSKANERRSLLGSVHAGSLVWLLALARQGFA